MDFHEKRTTKKGDYAESLVVRELEAINFAVYVTESERNHPFDIIYTGSYTDALGGNFNAGDVKAKARRKYYPDTGLDVRAFNYYKKIKEHFSLDRFNLFFVDEEVKKCYYGEIDELQKKYLSYPRIERGIIYFHLDTLIHFFDLTDEEANKLISLTTKDDKYK